MLRVYIAIVFCVFVCAFAQAQVEYGTDGKKLGIEDYLKLAQEQEKKKFKKLEEETKKLKSQKSSSEKELAKLAKELENEKKAIEKMSTKN